MARLIGTTHERSGENTFRDEVKEIIHMLVDTYPNFHPADISRTIDTWTDLLQGYDIHAVEVAVKKYILTDTGGFAPSIGQIVGMMQDTRDGGGLTELEAWAMVSRAIGNSNYHAQEEFDALPETVRKAVGSADNLREWAMMESDTVHSVIQSHVVRNFRTVQQRAREDAKLPPGFRFLLQSMYEGTEMIPEKKLEPKKEIPEKIVREIPETAERKIDEMRKAWGKYPEKKGATA